MTLRCSRRRALLWLGSGSAGAWAQAPVPAPASAPAQVPGFAEPGAWQHQTLPKVPRANQFATEAQGGRTVLRVDSKSGASSWVARLDADPAATPWLHWQWKVSRALPGSDIRHKPNDDYAARLYVFFALEESRIPFGDRVRLQMARTLAGVEVPAAALCYVWGQAQPAGSSGWNPYTNRLRMVVLDSGDAQAGQWRSHRRHLGRDFQEAFGGEVPRISGVAVGVDTDNTADEATAWFTDLRLAAT